MTRLQRLSLASLLVGLILAALVVPKALSSLQTTAKLLSQQQEQLAADLNYKPAPAQPVDPQAQVARQLEEVRRAVAQKAATEQAAKLAAELRKPAKPVFKAPVEPSPAYSLVPTGSPELIPLEGWVDQPNKNRPGRVHTNLMWRYTKASAKPKVASRAPCLVPVQKRAERIVRPYGYVDVPARTILVPCAR